jgi:hypothetical protein
VTPQAPGRAPRPPAGGADRFHPAPLVTPPAMADTVGHGGPPYACPASHATCAPARGMRS